ncbi:putative phenylalanyl-tRNA synthetase, alpha subunit [Candidatus Hodgkinia cicadicola Dsem]|nr:putative phenylalanyl-tRNA synthetase, alpha subunit [Candidatus Hodgkinia cicadicola Dsem]
MPARAKRKTRALERSLGLKPSFGGALCALEHRACAVMTRLGFGWVEANEVCDVQTNFFNLNFSRLHPAVSRLDTFYASAGASVLRTHTTAFAVRALSSASGAPFRSFTIGKVYRRDDDSKHLPSFTQLEGLVAEAKLCVASAVKLLKRAVYEILEWRSSTRVRRAAFPFTSPSIEVDAFAGSALAPTSVWHKWLEVAGAGVIRECVAPAHAGGVFAFGMGLERLLMTKLGVVDLRPAFGSQPAPR